jgi:xanthosine utilization system XapX-like protein
MKDSMVSRGLQARPGPLSAPPPIALIGLLGILIGEQAVGFARHHLAPPAQISIPKVPDDVQGLSNLSRPPAVRGPKERPRP